MLVIFDAVFYSFKPSWRRFSSKFDVKSMWSVGELLSADGFLSKVGTTCLELYLSPSVGVAYDECAVG